MRLSASLGYWVCLVGVAGLLGGCSESDPGGAGNVAGAGLTSAGNGAGGSPATAGASPGGGVSATGGNGTAGAMPGGGAAPLAGNNPGGGAPAGGSGGMPSGPPTGVNVTSHDLPVTGGSVFNVADNYFNDGFIPPTPVANFGCHSQITAVANDDGSLDVAWLDYTSGKGRPWATNSPAMINITHIDAALTTATTQASGVSSYKLLGFSKDAAGAFYIAYNKDHALKGSGENNVNGNELHVTKVSGGTAAWDTLLFGNTDNNQEATKGDPGGAASGVLGYDAMNQKLVLYVGHSMMWNPVRHQAGFIRLLDPGTGAVVKPSGDDIIHFGSGWWYSHNFNQRLLIDGGNYYMLAHGDAYSRTLGFARWSVDGYTKKNDTDFNESYWDIDGGEGDNNTNAQTGQMAKLSDGRFVITHTTSQGRGARDVRVVLTSGTNGKPEDGAVWLTQNQGSTQATIAKVEQLGNYLVVTYALWDSSKNNNHTLNWYAAVLDTKLVAVVAPKPLTGVEFVDAAPLFRFKGGPNAGQLGWVSGNATHTLSVRVASLAY